MEVSLTICLTQASDVINCCSGDQCLWEVGREEVSLFLLYVFPLFKEDPLLPA